MPRNALPLLTLVPTLLIGCSKKAQESATGRTPIQAEVFITTKDGETLKLSNVPFAPWKELALQNFASEYSSTTRLHTKNGFHMAILQMPWGSTDANGKITLFSLKNEGIYWAARAVRTLPDGTKESYCWLEHVKAGDSKPLRFSNDNLWTIEEDGAKIGYQVTPQSNK